jgi:pimeloyl-ACP methyl ester carboxylesterase
MSTTPTVVLVHGAFADAASWSPVTRELLDRGYTVRVPAGYNRSLIGDAAYIRQFVEGIDEPVVLAGHSYGGAVIGIAGMAENVIGLVCVSGYVPAEGETLGQLQARFPDSPLAPNLVLTPVETANGQITDVSVKIEEFPSLFALGVDPAVAEVLAVSQRPLASVVFEEVAPVSAWTSKPSWGIVSAADRTINPDVERFGYERAGFRGVVELDAPHLVMQTHPKDVADLIENAITATAASVRVPPAPQIAETEASGFRPSSAPVSGHR